MLICLRRVALVCHRHAYIWDEFFVALGGIMRFTKSIFLAALLLCASAGTAFATNGLLLEGYGPVSHAMGGTSMAFDNGAAAMTNNPATLGLAPEGNRIDIAVGLLRPNVRWDMGPGMSERSDAKSFVMPALGYVRRQGDWAFGIGAYALGGMGTDYPNAGMYSQLVVGKVLLPVAYNITDKLTVGGTLEYIKADMDLVMTDPMSGMRVFDFRDGSDFTGAASGSGVSGKLGMTYKLHERVTFGSAYQFKGELSDLTGDGARVKNLNMPANWSAGFAVKPFENVMLTADYTRIFWSDAMKTLHVSQGNMAMPMKQNWKDQDVLALGVAWDVIPQLTLRAGVNFANNPIQENCVPLFPAIIRNHYTTGFGYRFNENHSVDASFGYAPKVEKANAAPFPGSVSHSQTTSQLMYSIKF